ncbi:MAG: hypothetical protein ABIH18_04680 [Candidatus Omnitrophota bacterium]
MKLIPITTLLIRFSRMKLRKAKNSFKAIIAGDNYPVISINQKFFLNK